MKTAIQQYLEKYRIEDLKKDIYSILSSNLSYHQKLTSLAENYAPRLDYAKANFLINLHRKYKNKGSRNE